MRFLESSARDLILQSSLKLAVIALSIVSVTFGMLLASDLTREPVIVERACETRLLSMGSANQTREEIEAFIREAVPLRFNSLIAKDANAFMTGDLLASRTKEQEELKRTGVDQRLIVRKVKTDKDRIVIEADRLVAIGHARSAIPLRLAAEVASKPRSVSNPYGLVLKMIDQEKEAKLEE